MKWNGSEVSDSWWITYIDNIEIYTCFPVLPNPDLVIEVINYRFKIN